MTETLIMIAVAALVGALVMPIMQGLKKASAWVDGLPAWAKQAIVGGLSLGATYLSVFLGAPVPGDILHMPGEAVSALLTAVFAMLAHKVFKAKTA